MRKLKQLSDRAEKKLLRSGLSLSPALGVFRLFRLFRLRDIVFCLHSRGQIESLLYCRRLAVCM